MQLDISNFPEIVSNMFGTSVFAGGIFCTLLVTIAIMIPLYFVSKGKASPYMEIIVGCLMIFFGIAVGWLAEIIGIVVVGAVALGYAFLISDTMDGGD